MPAKKSKSPKRFLINQRALDEESSGVTYRTGEIRTHSNRPIPERLKAPKTPGGAR